MWGKGGEMKGMEIYHKVRIFTVCDRSSNPSHPPFFLFVRFRCLEVERR